jgi:hypothetical protein
MARSTIVASTWIDRTTARITADIAMLARIHSLPAIKKSQIPKRIWLRRRVMKSYLSTFEKASADPNLSTSYIVESRAKSLAKSVGTGEIMLFPLEFKD